MWINAVHTRISELRAELAMARELEHEAIARRRTVEARLEELERLVDDERRRLAPRGGGFPVFVTAEARGRRMITILECLAEVSPGGLTTREIIESARHRHIELNPGSTRAQLSQAQRKGWVTRNGHRYALTLPAPSDPLAAG